MARHGADAQAARLFTDIVQIAEAMNIDQIFRPGHPEFHHRHQTLAAGEQFGVVAMLVQQGQRFFNAIGAQIFKRNGIHGYIAFLENS